jgi:hypothetical protein
MDIKKWIRSRYAANKPLNLHAVAREKPEILEKVFAGPKPRGWRRTLIDAGADPYKIVHDYQQEVECKICGQWSMVLGTHLDIRHQVNGEEYRQEFGADVEISSEAFRAAQFRGYPIKGIAHWEGLWSRFYLIDWIIRLGEEGHDLNFLNINQGGKTLVQNAWATFGSWDAALIVAGFKPQDERRHPVGEEWDVEKTIKSLQEYAKRRRKHKSAQMPNGLRAAIKRRFASLKSACKAADLKYEEISSRAVFKSPKVTNFVNAIRKLENMKGQERRNKLLQICHKNHDHFRIMRGHYTSLKKLAQLEGIDERLISMKAYRDEADVHHDLDLIEGKMDLCYSNLKKHHLGLYNVISATGWGRERLVTLPRLKGKHTVH